MGISIREIIALNLWDRYCKETGTNEWAINEGLLDKDEIVKWELKEHHV